MQQENTKSAAEAKATAEASRAAAEREVARKADDVTKTVIQAKAEEKAKAGSEVNPVPRVSLRKRNKHVKIFEDLVKVLACVCVFVCVFEPETNSQEGSIIKWKGFDSSSAPEAWTRVKVLFVNQEKHHT